MQQIGVVFMVMLVMLVVVLLEHLIFCNSNIWQLWSNAAYGKDILPGKVVAIVVIGLLLVGFRWRSWI